LAFCHVNVTEVEIDFCISSKAVMIEEAVQEAMKAMYQGVILLICQD